MLCAPLSQTLPPESPVLLGVRERLVNVLQCGQGWSGSGWDTTSCARRIRELTAVALISPRFDDYRNSFLMSLALAAHVPVPLAELPDRCADVAFLLADLWGSINQVEKAELKEKEVTGKHKATTDMSEDEDDAAEEDDERLAWEPEQVVPPQELLLVTKRVAAGEKLPVAMVLSGVPTFQGIKTKAEINNHAKDGANMGDRWLRALQQRLLNLARLQVVQYASLQGDEEVTVLGQQVLYYILETEALILQERKRRSIPGSVAEKQNCLFTGDDLKREKQAANINSAGDLDSVLLGRKVMSSFPIPTGTRGWKYKGPYRQQAGKGKGGSWRANWKGAGRLSFDKSHKQHLPKLSTAMAAGKGEEAKEPETRDSQGGIV